MAKSPADRTAERKAALWQAVGKVAEENENRDRLAAGGKYEIGFSLVTNVDGEDFKLRHAGDLTVDHLAPLPGRVHQLTATVGATSTATSTSCSPPPTSRPATGVWPR